MGSSLNMAATNSALPSESEVVYTAQNQQEEEYLDNIIPNNNPDKARTKRLVILIAIASIIIIIVVAIVASVVEFEGVDDSNRNSHDYDYDNDDYDDSHDQHVYEEPYYYDTDYWSSGGLTIVPLGQVQFVCGGRYDCGRNEPLANGEIWATEYSACFQSLDDTNWYYTFYTLQSYALFVNYY